jgi:RNA polymerase sigma factor (sigma-70 family)
MKTASLQRVTAQLRQLAGHAAGCPQTDRQLLDRFLALGEEAAFTELVRRHGPMVLAVCRGVLHHQQDAEDAFQAAFLVLARKAGSVRHAESVAGWLFQVARRLALRARGKGGRHTEQLTAMHEPISHADEPAFQPPELQALLDEAMERLPEHYRAAVVVCYFEGKSQAEAARQLGTTPDGINSRLKRARQLLRDHLRRRGLPLATGAVIASLAARGASAAGLPAEVVLRTSAFAVRFAADPSAACGASPRATHLAQGALRTMLNHPLRILCGLALAGLLFAAVWWPAAVGGDTPPTPAVVAAIPAPAAAVPQLAGGPAKEQPDQRMHVILMWMSGGPSQFETFDPKPGQVNGGPTKGIDTTIKGMQFSEYLPQLAKIADQLTVIRSLSHKEGDHMRSTSLMRTGYAVDQAINYPSLGCVLGKYLVEGKPSVPRYVVIDAWQFASPEVYGPGFLGAKFGPVYVGAPEFGKGDPGGKDPRVPGAEAFPSETKEQAAKMRESVLKAFDVASEKQALRDAYGMNRFGQSCLLARRLVEAGVPVVEVHLGGWDTHANNFNLVEGQCKVLDPAFAALVRDLKERKLLERTVIVWMGEFGRTPRINAQQGRDHWPFSFSVVLTGGKTKPGTVIGSTKADGAGVAERPVTSEEFLATVYLAAGVDPTQQNVSNTGQPARLVPAGAAKGVPEALR